VWVWAQADEAICAGAFNLARQAHGNRQGVAQSSLPSTDVQEQGSTTTTTTSLQSPHMVGASKRDVPEAQALEGSSAKRQCRTRMSPLARGEGADGFFFSPRGIEKAFQQIEAGAPANEEAGKAAPVTPCVLSAAALDGRAEAQLPRADDAGGIRNARASDVHSPGERSCGSGGRTVVPLENIDTNSVLAGRVNM